MKKKHIRILFLLLLLFSSINLFAKFNKNPYLKLLLKLAKKKVYLMNKSKFILYKSGMSIDADGSPRAYHPKKRGLDYLKNAGKNGKWWALVTKKNKKADIPIIQNKKDPAPGYFVSTTSLYDKTKKLEDPNRYVNAEEIPYYVIPKKLLKMNSIHLGDLGFVYNWKNRKYSYAIFADVGSNKHIGEGSIALAKTLGINANPKNGGTDDDVVYLLFPKSGEKKPLTKYEIKKRARKLFIKWGGLKRFKKIINKKYGKR